MSRFKIILSLFVLTFIALFSARSAHAADIDNPEYWKSGRQELAKMGDGFIVWESNRTGRWRIWRINLDGGGLRQISPDGEEDEHFAPHISPDGKQIAYLRYPRRWRTYNALKPDKGKVPLHIVGADGKNDRMIVEDSRLYGEDRGVVWLNNQELMYIGPDRMTYRLDIKSGKQSPLLDKPATGDDWGYGFLLDPQLRYATTGKPSFSAYDAKTQAIADRKGLGGCQPYFTRDGRWGFWMGGAGGPINRFDLESGKATPIIEKNDARMPKERSYLYFPMISADSRLFTFAASPNKHDHFGSDYDIFVARLTPSTLEMIGKPVRYTFDKSNDRFPDVFLADLELGEHSGKAPYTVALAPEEKGEWEWNFGDGTKMKGATARHEYSKAGEYDVEARQGKRVLRGRVQVLVAQPPQVVAAAARGEKEIVVRFNEPVELKNLSLKLDKAKVAQWKPGSDGRSLDITLASKLESEDKLTLSGVSDRAQKPNVLGSTSLTVRPLSWPISREGLLYAWETGDRPNLVADANGVERAYQLKPTGQAHFNRHYAMRLGNGSYLVQGADDALLKGLKQSNAFTLEATILPDHFNQTGPARIVTFSVDTGSRAFTLGQDKDKLVLRLRTSKTDDNGSNPTTDLGALSLTEPTHILITYQPGRLVAYRNGKKLLESDKVQGDFGGWGAQHFLFGDEWGGQRDWAGTLEGVALYNRVLSAEEASRSFEQYQTIRAARKTVPQIEVQAKLIARSKMPILKEIQPYREALVVYEYEVEKVLNGKYDGKTIRVAHWAILDGKTLPIGEVKEGQSQKLVLERFEDNPQIKSIYQADSLPENFDLLPYFDVSF